MQRKQLKRGRIGLKKPNESLISIAGFETKTNLVFHATSQLHGADNGTHLIIDQLEPALS